MSTPSLFKDFSAADLTYSGLPLKLLKSLENPNLVARKISSRFPVRLNLNEGLMSQWVYSQKQNKKAIQYAPLSNEILRIEVGVRGIPESTSFFQRNVQHLCAFSWASTATAILYRHLTLNLSSSSPAAP